MQANLWIMPNNQEKDQENQSKKNDPLRKIELENVERFSVSKGPGNLHSGRQKHADDKRQKANASPLPRSHTHLIQKSGPRPITARYPPATSRPKPRPCQPRP
jgi:hypothetical protein